MQNFCEKRCKYAEMWKEVWEKVYILMSRVRSGRIDSREDRKHSPKARLFFRSSYRRYYYMEYPA